MLEQFDKWPLTSSQLSNIIKRRNNNIAKTKKTKKQKKKRKAGLLHIIK